jgi:hypothetical protein
MNIVTQPSGFIRNGKTQTRSETDKTTPCWRVDQLSLILLPKSDTRAAVLLSFNPIQILHTYHFTAYYVIHM